MLRAGLGQSTDDGAKVRVVAFAERKDLASFAGDRSYGSIEGGVRIEQAVGFHSLDPEGRLVFAYAADADAVDDEAFRETVAYAATTALPYLGARRRKRPETSSGSSAERAGWTRASR
jgi:hypothetical protein